MRDVASTAAIECALGGDSHDRAILPSPVSARADPAEADGLEKVTARDDGVAVMSQVREGCPGLTGLRGIAIGPVAQSRNGDLGRIVPCVPRNQNRLPSGDLYGMMARRVARHGAIDDTHAVEFHDGLHRIFGHHATSCNQGSQGSFKSFDVMWQSRVCSMVPPMGELCSRSVVGGVRKDWRPVRVRRPADVIEVEMRKENMRHDRGVDPGTTQFVRQATRQAVEIGARVRAEPGVDQRDPAALLHREHGKASLKLVIREPSPDKVRMPGEIGIRKGVGCGRGRRGGVRESEQNTVRQF